MWFEINLWKVSNWYWRLDVGYVVWCLDNIIVYDGYGVDLVNLYLVGEFFVKELEKDNNDDVKGEVNEGFVVKVVLFLNFGRFDGVL